MSAFTNLKIERVANGWIVSQIGPFGSEACPHVFNDITSLQAALPGLLAPPPAGSNLRRPGLEPARVVQPDDPS